MKERVTLLRKLYYVYNGVKISFLMQNLSLDGEGFKRLGENTVLELLIFIVVDILV